MNRYDFIEKLRAALSGKATQSTINESVRYYEEYIDTEIRKGRAENDILQQLGDPRLLAKSIVEANRQMSYTNNRNDNYQDTVDYGTDSEKKSGYLHMNGKEYKVSWWVPLVIVALVLLFIVSLVGTVLRIVLPIVIPVVLIVAAVKILTVLFKKQ